jgi:hypothetical protein
LTSRETSHNPKNRTPWRPKVDFYTIYDDFWHPVRDHFSYTFTNCEKLVFEQQYGTLAAFSLPKTSPFRFDFSSKFHVFLGHAPGPHFSSFYASLLPKREILGPLQNPAGAKMPPQICTNPQFCQTNA